jgi:hypothetical protein
LPRLIRQLPAIQATRQPHILDQQPYADGPKRLSNDYNRHASSDQRAV